MKKPLLQKLAPLIGIALFAVALWVLHHALAKYNFKDIVRLMREMPWSRLLPAFGLTALSYLTLTFYDALAFRFIQRALPWRRIALASFVGYVFSHNMGASLLSGGSVRYRLYSAWGLSAGEISLIVLFCGITFWLGLCLVGSAVLLVNPNPPVLPALPGLPVSSTASLGLICLAIVVACTAWIVFRRRPIRIRSWTIPVPSPGLYGVQMLISSVDWLLAGAVLYVLLPPAPGLTFGLFLGAFMLAQVLGMLAHVPGGLGVFELVMGSQLTPMLRGDELAACLLAYRLVYYLIPFGLATLMLAGHELLERRTGVRRVASLFGPWVSRLVPQAMAFATFLAGGLLLFSGATPATTERLMNLSRVLPHSVLEASHFLGSVAGMALLLLARGLQKRLAGAWLLTCILLAAGTALALVKGLEWEEAALLFPLLLLLLPCRGLFPRRTKLLAERFSATWAAAVLVVLGTSVWLGLFAFRHVDYRHELWWQFTLDGEAPRFLRASVGAGVLGLVYALARLLSPALPRPALPTPAELQRAATIAASSPDTRAQLALLGDKALLFSSSGRSFLMFAVQGRSLVAMGGPVGPPSEAAELAWAFRELCEREAAWPVFYEVGPAHLPLCLDLGLALIKIGESARVALPTFSLEEGARDGLRQDVRRAQEHGCRFELVPATRVPALLPELATVSAAWLAGRGAVEKSFSLGRFEPAYVSRFPAALVRREGRIVAFATVWCGAAQEELSVDVVRHLPDAPPGVMGFLFVQIMSWGQQQGYRWFDLGCVPLSGLPEHELASVWSRLAALVYRHSEHFPDLQALRAWKETFDPAWEARYIACPGGTHVTAMIDDVAALISGGWKGLLPR